MNDFKLCTFFLAKELKHHASHAVSVFIIQNIPHCKGLEDFVD